MIVRVTLPLIAFLSAASTGATAASIQPADLGTRSLGAFVVGPVGQTVDSSFLGEAANPGEAQPSAGDFSGGAACPTGAATCVPPQNAPDTIYTYVQTVVPGLDAVANDAPFAPGVLTDPGVIDSYALGFAPAGFTGVAGYDFAGAEQNALAFEIDQDDATGALTWTSVGEDWTAGTAVTFFFEAAAPPSGPGGTYLLSGSAASGAAAGPLPALVDAAPVPIPAGLPLAAAALGLLGLLRFRRA